MTEKKAELQRGLEARHIELIALGGTLVLRTAKKGANAGNSFYGCSNYPKCRYVQNI